MKKYSGVAVTGSIAYDEIMDFPAEFVSYFHPEKLHQINVSFVVNRLEKQIGGIATNISYNLSLITNKKILPLGGVGKDGDTILNFFKSNSISTDGIKVSNDLYTATGKVITDIKDNQIWGYYYGALELGKTIDLEKYVNASTLLIIAPTHADSFLHFQKEAIKHGIDYLYDPGMALSVLSAENIKEGIKHAAWLIGNDYEIAMIERITGLKVKDIITSTAVITTLGEKGVRYLDKEKEYYIPAYKTPHVVDPTGAGDAWRGGFIGALVEGKTVQDALIMGNVLASFVVEKYGTVNHVPTRKDVESRFKDLRLMTYDL